MAGTSCDVGGVDGVPEAWRGAPAEAWLAAVVGVRDGATACPNLLASVAHPAYRDDPAVKEQVRVTKGDTGTV